VLEGWPVFDCQQDRVFLIARMPKRLWYPPRLRTGQHMPEADPHPRLSSIAWSVLLRMYADLLCNT
jgi:hypothetical protein